MGFTILIVAVLRLLWALSNGSRRPQHEGPPYERRWVTIGQVALYGLMTVVPFLGFSLLLAEAHGITVWGVTLIPEGGTKDERFAEPLEGPTWRSDGRSPHSSSSTSCSR